MTPEQFCYWLQGFAELGGERPSEAQWKSIIEHVQTVFVKVTPPMVNPSLPFPPGVRQPEFRDHLDRAWPSKIPEITC